MRSTSKTNIDLGYIKSILKYDRGSGEFFWNKKATGRIRKSGLAGSYAWNGRRVINIDGSLWLAHRLAWLYVYGKLPNGDLDHIDRNPQNNRIENLRIVTHRQNHQNRKNNREIIGIYGVQNNKYWAARARVNGKTIYLGCSKDPKVVEKMYSDFVGGLING
jgi:HNH endonuclease